MKLHTRRSRPLLLLCLLAIAATAADIPQLTTGQRLEREMSPDEFTGDAWYFSKVRFERDDDCGIVAMRVSSGRVKDVRFERGD